MYLLSYISKLLAVSNDYKEHIEVRSMVSARLLYEKQF